MLALGRMSLRLRLVLLGTAGLGIGLVLGVLLLAATLRIALERSVDDAARTTAQEVATLVDARRLPDPVPVGGTTVVQVLDEQGAVLAVSAGADRLVAALQPAEIAAVQAGEVHTIAGDRFGVNGVVRVVAVSTVDRVILVAAPAGDIDGTVAVVRTSLLLAFAVLLIVLAALAWRIVGITLRPVEALRAGAAEITGAGSTASLPVPTSQDEIHRLAETLNDMLGRLDSARGRQRAFVADAAHELRSPLASLRTQLEVAAAIDGTVEIADLLVEVERMTRLVDDLLLLARADETAPRRHERVDVAQLAGDVAARTGGGRVRVLADVVAASIEADPGAVLRIVSNLVDNAVRYAVDTVTVSVRCRDDHVLLTVVDDGPGIPTADRERVFERFTRLAAARDRDSGGTGLGLAIVAALVHQCGGAVTLSDAGPGLRAEVRFPRSIARTGQANRA